MNLKLKFALTASLMGAPGCQCQRAESTASAFPAHDSKVFYATNQVELDDIRDFFKQVFGASDYITQWSEIDKFRAGSVDDARIPYVDTWYPEAANGTNRAGSLNKYDQAFYAGESRAAKWEVDNHSRQTPAWYGHCNGTSVSGSRYQSPKNSVKRPKGCVVGSASCVEFSPADVRALLSEMNMNAKAQFISGRRCSLTDAQLKSRPMLRSDPTVMDACDDVNPGSFHVSLVNFLGRMKQPIIFDQSQNNEVWNYPIYKYKYTVSGPLDEASAVAALQLGEPLENWVFNPKARSWYKVNMTVSYRNSTNDVPPNAGATLVDSTDLNYEYVLELDDNGDIIGGEWVGPHRYNHPDFIWMPFEPADPTGDSSRGNPLLSTTEVTSIWAESVGLDPANPFRDKPKNVFDVRFYPPNDLTWGIVSGYYKMLLDGRNTGSLFLGKKSHLRVEVADILKDANVEVFLNGKALDTVSPTTGSVDLLFDSPPGLNILTMKWASAHVNESEVDWEFKYYAM